MAKKQHISFEEYLRREFEQGKYEFRLVVSRPGEHIKLYIHPLTKDGDSRDFEVNETEIRDVTRWFD